MTLAQRLEQRDAHVTVVGLGYVGLPMAIEVAKAGFQVTGYDLDPGRVQAVNQGKPYVSDVAAAELEELLGSGHLIATTDPFCLQGANVVLICVPTPINRWKEPDLACVRHAAEQVRSHLRRQQLVILESTTYPGTTTELIQPVLAESGLEVGRDYWIAYSPERIDPGNRKYALREIPKVVGGVTPACTHMAQAFYRQFIDRVVPVSSATAAEMVKLYENVFRNINIAFVNELATLCDRMKLDVWEIIDAASSKPYGFMPFYPGPGLGGHCIPVDPHYLAWKAREYDFHCSFVELAATINDNMPYFVRNKVASLLNESGKSLKRSRVVVLGVTYKADVADARESPALKVIQLLREAGAKVAYHDPYVPELAIGNPVPMHSQPLTPGLLGGADVVLITTNHSCFDPEFITRHAPLVLDTRNALRNTRAQNVCRL